MRRSAQLPRRSNLPQLGARRISPYCPLALSLIAYQAFSGPPRSLPNVPAAILSFPFTFLHLHPSDIMSLLPCSSPPSTVYSSVASLTCLQGFVAPGLPVLLVICPYITQHVALTLLSPDPAFLRLDSSFRDSFSCFLSNPPSFKIIYTCLCSQISPSLSHQGQH